METQQLLKFGSFALRADQNVLELDGKAVPMTPKMFDTLLVLVTNHGRIVEKETILREVWPDSFVEEGNIAFNIRQLRKVLGDDAQAPSYIETVPKRGYRFISPVEAVIEKEAAAASEPEARTTERGRSYSSIVVLGIVCPILIAAAFLPTLYWFDIEPDSGFPILSSPFAIEKLSTDGNLYHAVLSADGKSMVYTHRNGSGKQSLWLRDLETSNNIQIVPPSDHFYGGVELSPDGETVYFARGSQTGPQTDIYRMPVRGGLPEKIIDSTQGWISVSPDGSRLSFVRCPYTEDDHCSLYIADTLDGKNEKRLAKRSKLIRIGDNQISPDGRKVAFGAGQSRTASNDFGLFEVDIESGEERALTPQRFFNIGYLSYLPDQGSVLMTAMQRPDHDYPIWQVTLADGAAKKLTTDSECYSRLTLDRQARILLTTRVTPDFRLYVNKFDTASAPPVAIADASTVSFAPDSKLLFSSSMSGNPEIWTANADGSGQIQLTNEASADVRPIASPDGKFIYFASDRGGTLNVWRMGRDGTDARQLTNEEGGYPLAVSSDGNWVFFRSGLNGAIRKVDPASGAVELVVNDLGRNTIVSPDGETIAFTKREQSVNTISLYSIRESRVIRAIRIETQYASVMHLAWTGDSKQLAYILADDKKENARLYIRSIDGSAHREVADLRGDSIFEMGALALSDDGFSFAVIKGNWKHDAMLIKGLK